jgi:endoglucanase
VDELYIDIGYSKTEAEARVSPGDRVTPLAPARPLLNGIVSGRALDNRAGCAALLKALEYLGGRKLDMGLSVLFSSMEEVGGMGARTGAYIAEPTHAVAVDVSFAHTPDAKPEKTGILGKGPMIGFAPILSAATSAALCDLAKENRIPFQREAMGGRTGTNADVIATSRYGVKTGLVSIPLKYMHTPVEAVSVEDVENTARLIAAYCVALSVGRKL